ncbi:hypothetical protein NDU88_005438 [Pleurodeles waltl]|uniref:Uncharacterized protein n=1 Tax=Pleurodeles waltl TaxID=8319 RepID=A0AAV7WB08_PLEWA|nr:hypothetical protein NDU88_005438 [Pleurodeles waltl]
MAPLARKRKKRKPWNGAPGKCGNRGGVSTLHDNTVRGEDQRPILGPRPRTGKENSARLEKTARGPIRRRRGPPWRNKLWVSPSWYEKEVAYLDVSDINYLIYSNE